MCRCLLYCLLLYLQVFTTADRAGLLDDVFILARSGKVNYDTALHLTIYMVHEKEYVPWVVFLTDMGFLWTRWVLLCIDSSFTGLRFSTHKRRYFPYDVGTICGLVLFLSNLTF